MVLLFKKKKMLFTRVTILTKRFLVLRVIVHARERQDVFDDFPAKRFENEIQKHSAI